MSANAPSASGTSPSESRYERVKRILNTAQGSNEPSYQGYHRFWELPLAELLELSLYGVRLIAPAASAESEPRSGLPQMTMGSGGDAGSSCCSSQPRSGGDAASAPSSGRGAASGLIKGLKGEAPFDGSQFPPLPWGGSRVSTADIAFIEQWIDDGCPASDSMLRASAIEARQATLLALAAGREAHPRSLKTLNAQRAELGGLKVRKNVETLSPTELARYRDAITEMRKLDSYYQDQRSYLYWARIHAQNCQHNWQEFLTWHRAYLYSFEKQLQDIDPDITIPYWDWSVYNQDWTNPKNEPDTGNVAKAFHCFVDDDVLAELKGKVPDETLAKLATTRGKTFDSANRLYTAAGLPWSQSPDQDPILAALEQANPLWHRFRWPGWSSALFENYPRPEDDERILQIKEWFPFGSGPTDDNFFGALENVHNLLHLFTGGTNPNYDAKRYPNPWNRIEPQFGDMFSNSTTTFDPFFWSYHSNVDRLWDLWQQRHPCVNADNPTSVLPPFNFTVADTFSVKKLGYEYGLDSTVYQTNPDISLLRFKAAPAAVHPHALENHSRAEVRLHGIRYAPEGSGLLRVFLNQPDANEATTTKGNDHYVGQFALFAGGCIGGPGHCEPPPREKLPHDKRQRHMKTPGNIRMNATETVAKLRAQGAKDFQIQVVTLGIDGKAAPDILRMEAVSLNFFD